MLYECDLVCGELESYEALVGPVRAIVHVVAVLVSPDPYVVPIEPGEVV